MSKINNWKHRGIMKLRKLVGSSMDASHPVESREEIIGLGSEASRNRFGRIDLSGDLGAPRRMQPGTERARRTGRTKPADEVA